MRRAIRDFLGFIIPTYVLVGMPSCLSDRREAVPNKERSQSVSLRTRLFFILHALSLVRDDEGTGAVKRGMLHSDNSSSEALARKRLVIVKLNSPLRSTSLNHHSGAIPVN